MTALSHRFPGEVCKLPLSETLFFKLLIVYGGRFVEWIIGFFIIWLFSLFSDRPSKDKDKGGDGDKNKDDFDGLLLEERKIFLEYSRKKRLESPQAKDNDVIAKKLNKIELDLKVDINRADRLSFDNSIKNKQEFNQRFLKTYQELVKASLENSPEATDSAVAPDKSSSTVEDDSVRLKVDLNKAAETNKLNETFQSIESSVAIENQTVNDYQTSANKNVSKLEWMEDCAASRQDQAAKNPTKQADRLDCANVIVKKSVTPSPASFFKNHGVLSLWHITHCNNLESIVQHGIVSNKHAYSRFQPLDISNHDVQKWRDRVEPFHGRMVHEYAPLYINVRNPMLFAKKNLNNELCLLEVSLSVLNDSYFIFTDGNAASRDTKFFENLKDLNMVPWDVLSANYWNDFPDGKRKRCAEILVYPKVSAFYITKIHCFSTEVVDFARDKNIRAKLSKDLFF
jgi:hypothetical protein